MGNNARSKVSNPSGSFDTSLGDRGLQDPVGEKPVNSSSESAAAPGQSPSEIDRFSREEVGRIAREIRGWGQHYKPELDAAEARQEYRRICDSIKAEVRLLQDYVEDGYVVDEASGVIAEIQDWLETLYDCPFGEGESLKSVVVGLQSQLNNVRWTKQHVDFLTAAIHQLCVRWVVNDQTADDIDDMIEEFGLDVFRGTVSDSDVLVEYRIEKVETD